MKTFDVYQHPQRWGYEAIKRGFSWPAFFFTWMWAFSKEFVAIGLAFLAVAFLAIVVLILVPDVYGLDLDIEGSELAGALLLFGLGAGVFFGIKGNEWRRLALLRAGWVRVERINAKSTSAAIEQYSDALRGGAT